MAQAQTYSLKEIKRPSGSTALCGDTTLADNGDLLLRCPFSEGLVYLTEPFPWVGVYTSDKVVAFRSNGAVQTLSLPTRQEVMHIIGADANGNVMARLMPMTPSKEPKDYKGGTLTWWKGGTRTTWTPPAGFDGDWQIGGVSANGTIMALSRASSPQQRKLAIFRGAQGQYIPLPPDMESGVFKPDDYSFEARGQSRITDKGQMIIELKRPYSGTGGPERVTAHWFWNGSQWLELPTIAAMVNPEIKAFGDNGDVVLADRFKQDEYLWSEVAGMRQLLELNESYGAPLGVRSINAKGVAVGTIFYGDYPNGPGDPSLQYKASIWINGQPVDLNTLVKRPSGVTFTSAQAINARGQIVVESRASTWFGGGTRRSWLLTPR